MHLDKLVDDPTSESVPATPVANIDRFYYDSGAGVVIPQEIKDRVYEMKFRERLAGFGLRGIEVEIVVSRFIYSMSLIDITKELKINGVSTTSRLLTNSLKLLKSKGFKRE